MLDELADHSSGEPLLPVGRVHAARLAMTTRKAGERGSVDLSSGSRLDSRGLFTQQ